MQSPLTPTAHGRSPAPLLCIAPGPPSRFASCFRHTQGIQSTLCPAQPWLLLRATAGAQRNALGTSRGWRMLGGGLAPSRAARPSQEAGSGGDLWGEIWGLTASTGQREPRTDRMRPPSPTPAHGHPTLQPCLQPGAAPGAVPVPGPPSPPHNIGAAGMRGSPVPPSAQPRSQAPARSLRPSPSCPALPGPSGVGQWKHFGNAFYCSQTGLQLTPAGAAALGKAISLQPEFLTGKAGFGATAHIETPRCSPHCHLCAYRSCTTSPTGTPGAMGPCAASTAVGQLRTTPTVTRPCFQKHLRSIRSQPPK